LNIRTVRETSKTLLLVLYCSEIIWNTVKLYFQKDCSWNVCTASVNNNEKPFWQCLSSGQKYWSCCVVILTHDASLKSSLIHRTTLSLHLYYQFRLFCVVEFANYSIKLFKYNQLSAGRLERNLVRVVPISNTYIYIKHALLVIILLIFLYSYSLKLAVYISIYRKKHSVCVNQNFWIEKSSIKYCTWNTLREHNSIDIAMYLKASKSWAKKNKANMSGKIRKDILLSKVC
jgi:hypothetical protein